MYLELRQKSLCMITLTASFVALSGALASGSEIVRVSVHSDGTQGNATSGASSVSNLEDFVLFASDASTLVENDGNNASDVFTHDVLTGSTNLISVNDDGEYGNDASTTNEVAADGRYVAFNGGATNFFDHDDNDTYDVFVRDRLRKTTSVVSVSSSGVLANFDSGAPAISPCGRYVGFMSRATNLIDNDDNGFDDIFVHDLQMSETVCVSLNSEGRTGNSNSTESPPAISNGGRYVAFVSDATDLVSKEDGELDSNGTYDIFRRDMIEKKTIRISFGPDGEIMGTRSILPYISADGRYVVFYGEAYVFLRDVEADTTEYVSVSRRGSLRTGVPGGISADGRFVVFESAASDLVDESDSNRKSDIFVRDRQRGVNHRLSRSYDGGDPNGSSINPAISPNGRWVTFGSAASNLVPDDTNEKSDVFVIDFLGCSEHIRGDSNCDGTVDFDDIDPFVLALIDEGEYVLQNLSCDWECNNDINGDRTVDFNDIDGFVECLTNNGCG